MTLTAWTENVHYSPKCKGDIFRGVSTCHTTPIHSTVIHPKNIIVIMDEMNRIKRWISAILSEVSTLDGNQGIELLNACGRDCSKASPLLEGAIDIRNKFPDNEDIEELFQAFKKQYYNTSRFSKDDNKITLVFEECTCPIVKIGVSNSYLCNCTIGYSMQIFETLFGRPVEIRLIKSILKGDNICKQEILVMDV